MTHGLIAEAEALHLRSTTHQHAKLLDDWAQRVSPVEIPASMVKIMLALLDDHEVMNRRLADELRSQCAVLLKCADFVEAECEQRGSGGGSMTDYVGEAERLLAEIRGALGDYQPQRASADLGEMKFGRCEECGRPLDFDTPHAATCSKGPPL